MPDYQIARFVAVLHSLIAFMAFIFYIKPKNIVDNPPSKKKESNQVRIPPLYGKLLQYSSQTTFKIEIHDRLNYNSAMLLHRTNGKNVHI